MIIIKKDEILDIVKSYVLDKIDIEIIDIELYGSRTKEAAREDSDLDILLEYKGNIREDDLFNILNEDPLYIDDIKVDINPITGRTIKEYMKNLF
jgi:predicted nucleotidyltransferase